MRRILFVAATIGCSPALASPQTAVAPMAGYSCMTVSLPAGKLEWNQLPRARMQPDPDAPFVNGTVGQTIIARYPLHVTNGFAEVMLFNGETGWLPLKRIAGINRTCRAMKMSDGKPGLG